MTIQTQQTNSGPDLCAYDCNVKGIARGDGVTSQGGKRNRTENSLYMRNCTVGRASQSAGSDAPSTSIGISIAIEQVRHITLGNAGCLRLPHSLDAV